MALRSLYLILAKSVQQLLYLRHAVATILGFVGFKSMRIITTLLSRTPSPPSPPLTHTIAFSLSSTRAVVLEFFHVHVSSFLSLGIICALLAAGTIASIMHNRRVAAAGLEGLKDLSADANANGFKSIDVV